MKQFNVVMITETENTISYANRNTYLVWNIITMPSNHIEWRKILFCSEKLATKFLYNSVAWEGSVLKPRCGNQEIPWSSKTISPCMYWQLWITS